MICIFHPPKELKALLETQAENVSSSDFIRKPQHKPLKETWCAIQFGLGYEKHIAACWLRLNAEENSDTDFVLKTRTGQFLFQTTIADVPGRRMGEDHKPGPDGSLPTRPYEPERGRIEGPKWIADAVKEKVEKKYSNSRDLNLLVYANFTAQQMDYQAVCDEVEEYKSNFLSIWVITNHQICSLTTTPELGEIRHFANVYDPEELLSML